MHFWHVSLFLRPPFGRQALCIFSDASVVVACHGSRKHVPRRIIIFGATGFTGRLVAERLAVQGARPGARRALGGSTERARRPPRRRMAPGRRAAAQLGVRPAREGRRARQHGRAVRQVGRAGRAGGDRRGRHLHRLDRRAVVHPPRVRRARAAGRPRRGGAADGDGLRLRAGRARRRPGARRGGRGGRARRRRLLRVRGCARAAGTRASTVGYRARRQPRIPRRRA